MPGTIDCHCLNLYSFNESLQDSIFEKRLQVGLGAEVRVRVITTSV